MAQIAKPPGQSGHDIVATMQLSFLPGLARRGALRAQIEAGRADGAFDVIVCALAIHYASDRAAAFAEFGRVLRPGRAAVVSTQHPVMDWLRKGGSYFQTTLETDIWHTPSGDQHVHFWREPLSALCTAATDAGFLIENSSNRPQPKQCANAIRGTTRS